MAARAGFDTRRYLWKVSEVAVVLGIPARTLYDEITAGRLESVHLSPHIRPRYVTAEAVNEWIREEWSWR